MSISQSHEAFSHLVMFCCLFRAQSESIEKYELTLTLYSFRITDTKHAVNVKTLPILHAVYQIKCSCFFSSSFFFLLSLCFCLVLVKMSEKNSNLSTAVPHFQIGAYGLQLLYNATSCSCLMLQIFMCIDLPDLGFKKNTCTFFF